MQQPWPSHRGEPEAQTRETTALLSRTKDLPGHRAGVGRGAVQDVLPSHAGGTQPRALSWAVHAHPEPRGPTGTLPWPVRGCSFSRTSPPQPGHTSAGEHQCGQAPEFPPRPRPPELTGNPGLCASPIHPLIPPASLSTRWALPSPNTRSTQHRLRGCRPRLLCPELRGPRSGVSALKPGQTAISHLPGADLRMGKTAHKQLSLSLT